MPMRNPEIGAPTLFERIVTAQLVLQSTGYLTFDAESLDVEETAASTTRVAGLST
jgi:hypothetical protein